MGRREVTVLLFATAVFISGIVSPPSLLDDVDGAYAQIARRMLETGDFVTARLNGVRYLDKPPGQVWAMAASFAIFGVHDWAARLPMALACILLAWTTFGLGRWAFGEVSGYWSGLVMATSLGMWLFSRVRIPDPFLTLSIVVSLGCVLHLLEEAPRRRYALLLGASLGAGTLFKGLPAVVFPGAAVMLYLLWGGELLRGETWRRLFPATTLGAFAVVAGPWHVAAVVANPPYWDSSLESRLGVYRGFFWRYFINEHVLRYLGLRYPKDYATTPKTLYWLGHAIWLFPWSFLLPAAVRLPFAATDRAGRVRRLCLCWLGFVLLFFAFSTSQEYYTMSAYPAFALLIGHAVARGGAWVRGGRLALAPVCAAAAVACLALLWASWAVQPAGDITQSLTRNPGAYTLSLGHVGDLTLESFAWLRGPLVLAALAFAVGAVAVLRSRVVGLALMSVIFFQAARWAMAVFDPHLSSRPLAEAYNAGPPGRLVLDDQYYTFSSLVFYTNAEPVLLLGGRVNNIEYGANAPDAPDVFLDDAGFARLWGGSERVYFATEGEGPEGAVLVGEAGGKRLLVNRR